MSVESIQYQALPPAPKPEEGLDKLASPTTPVNHADNTAGESVGWTGFPGAVKKYQDLIIEHQVMNSVAQSARIADHAMEDIGKTVGDMKNTVDRIMKNYPPFPPGSEERIRLLRSYAELRKQIDQLTVPPDDGARQIMADPAVSGEGDWTIIIGSDGIVRTVPK
jgi:hypothetical protein